LFIIKVIIDGYPRGRGYPKEDLVTLERETDLITGLLSGKQGWKCPVSLISTCCGSKSLKVILIDSGFGPYPVLNPLVTLYVVTKMGDGGVFHTPCADFSRPVEE
jgi:hypothetical protein